MSCLPLVFLLSLLSISIQLWVKIDNNKQSYCFTKGVKEDDFWIFNYQISSEKVENININLYKGDKNPDSIIHQEKNTQSGTYTSPKPWSADRYSLCFDPVSEGSYYISFELYCLFESSGIKNWAKDKEVKQINHYVRDISALFKELEKNWRFTVDRRRHHTNVWRDVVDSVKKLTFLKIGIVVALSVFQIFVIQQFFGENKRVSNVAGAFKDGW